MLKRILRKPLTRKPNLHNKSVNRESRDTNPKLVTWTTGILVCLGTDFLWKFDRVYRRWNVFCVNRWHSNRIYTINQLTEKRRDTNPKLVMWTTGILVCLGTDFLWKFDRVYRCWNVFYVNRWHSNRIYTINQLTEKRWDTMLIRVLFKLEPYANFLVSSYLYRWW